MMPFRNIRRSGRWCCIGFLILAGLTDHALAQQQQQGPTFSDFDPAVYSQRLVRVTSEWLENKASSPGISAEMREIQREKRDDGLWVHYHVFAKGLPKDQLYNVLQWPINAREPLILMRGVSIAADGLVICEGRKQDQCRGEKPDDDVSFTFHPAKAEPYRLALVSIDERTKVYFGVVPDPMLAVDRDCSLEIVRLLPKFEVVMLRGKGFTPNSDLAFSGSSYGEAHGGSIKSDSHGKIVSGLLPFVTGKQSGTTDFTVKDASCAPKLSFEWGR
jgi:hypothetical protein